MKSEDFWLNAWYQGRWWLWLLWPLSLLFRALAGWRRQRQQALAKPFSAPVIVVGNITLGGTGKTPVIIALCQYLRDKGLNPGIVSRGYGGSASEYPWLVTAETPPGVSGDEPLLIARETGCPVMVGPDRVGSVEKLITEHGCNVLLSDDGLQHYRLSRQWEICVLDAARGLGNGKCLPAGPLRETPSRLQQVDCVLINGASVELGADAQIQEVDAHAMQLQPRYWRRVVDGESRSLHPQPWGSVDTVDAVTGIGNPERFFQTLTGMGVKVRGMAFPDHHPFVSQDLAFALNKPLLMTAKDAVKCQPFAAQDWWYLVVSAELPKAFYQRLDQLLQRHGLLRSSS
ncbi:tetraacyldisaccharide 4'-kinase [Pseudomaricurvus alkylphenolicus]|uniref:tetraacyldisaccharide 4'-kinase n=1 Tax=Pseudomaricurvus alkylphenolicus TaxID=1306991 RepID=UPI001420BAD7|nr:tetraacyldisaccharide 4'-kinase [Pseudomaricurvus alkylphenolicus]NIB41249.1 tetraacyldisaccharide 4'-kinase [Pseudomaricurvus alkylphenolicus]